VSAGAFSGSATARPADITAQAAVSEATVNRALDGKPKPGVCAATRTAVPAALDLLGYEPAGAVAAARLGAGRATHPW
jgi:DNA-binding LacI/PurR family transcriptional regulator